MTLLIFFVILGLLIFVHELGHFLVAKKAGVRVEEFGFGYPPRALIIGRKWGTIFSLNWIPFGGFVKIFGENYEDSSQKNNFTEVSKKWQVAILGAGVTFNILFAWLLFSLGFFIGLPTPVENEFGSEVKNSHLTIVRILPESPAQKVGLKTGDKIMTLEFNGNKIESPDAEEVSMAINENKNLNVGILRGRDQLNFEVAGESGIAENRRVIGIEMEMVGTLSLPLHKAVYQGGKATLVMTYLTANGLFNLAKDAVMGSPDISQVTGPVGIVGLVGDASRLGFSYLITFTSLISINLAIINLVPFPALDGGRILFVIIEAVTGKSINPKFAQITNSVGFALLITLMLFVTYRDIAKLF